MRDFDAAAFVEPEPLTPAQIKKIREKTRLSQAVFARRLNTSSSTAEMGDRCQAAERARAKDAGSGEEAWAVGA